MNPKIIIPIVSMFMLVACTSKPAQDAKGRQEPLPAVPAVDISVATVGKQDMTDTVHIFGEVVLRQEVLLASQFDGRLEGFTLLMGDRVIKGQKLGVIIPPMREALLQVLNQIEEKKREQISREIREIPLYSPIDGMVLEVYQHTGDVLQKGEAIVHIGQLQTLDVHGDLPVSQLGKVRKLKRIEVDFVEYAHAPVRLPVVAIGGKVNASRQTVPIRLRLDNPAGEFRPGMMVRLTFPGTYHPDALVIPRSALLEEEGVFSVFVLQKDRTVEKRKIIVGIRHDHFVEVLDGLKEGEKVATKKTYSLTDGMKVNVH